VGASRDAKRKLTHDCSVGTTTALCPFVTFGHYFFLFNERESIMVRKAIALICASMALMLAACNTMQGAGKDIERGGEKIQGAADRNK
jgi:entericidin B